MKGDRWVRVRGLWPGTIRRGASVSGGSQEQGWERRRASKIWGARAETSPERRVGVPRQVCVTVTEVWKRARATAS